MRWIDDVTCCAMATAFRSSTGACASTAYIHENIIINAYTTTTHMES